MNNPTLRHHGNTSILISLLAALFMLWIGPANADTDSVIRLGVSPSFAPYESVNKDGDLVGLDIDIGDAMCKHLQAKCKWVRINFDGAIPALNAKKIDAILSAMAITKKRKKRVLFSVPIDTSLNTLVTRKDVDLDSTAESLKGKRVGIAQGTMQANYAKKHWGPNGVTLVTFQNESLMQQNLELGRINAMFTDIPFSHTFVTSSQGKNFHTSGEPVMIGNGVAIAMRLHDTKLKKQIDDALQAIANDGTLQNIIDEYAKYGIKSLIEPTND